MGLGHLSAHGLLGSGTTVVWSLERKKEWCKIYTNSDRGWWLRFIFIKSEYRNRVRGKDEFFGRDEFYNSVIVKSDENLIGKLEEISIIDGNQNTLFGVRKDQDKKEFAA